MQSEQNSPDKSTNFSQQSDNQFEYRPEYDSDNPYQPPHSSFDEPEATFIGNYQKITFGDLIESNHSLSTKHVGSFIIIGLIFLLSLSPLVVVHVARELISRNVQGHKVINPGENNTPGAAGFVKSPLDLAFKFIELILDLFIGAFFAAGFAAYFLPLGKAGISRVGNFWNGMQYYGKVLTIIAIYHIPIQIVSAVGTFAIFMTFSSVQAILLSYMFAIAIMIVEVIISLKLYWAVYFTIDQNQNIPQALTSSIICTRGNMLTLFAATFCVATVCVVLSCCTCLIGCIYLTPYLFALYGTAYLKMTNQFTPHRQTANTEWS